MNFKSLIQLTILNISNNQEVHELYIWLRHPFKYNTFSILFSSPILKVSICHYYPRYILLNLSTILSKTCPSCFCVLNCDNRYNFNKQITIIKLKTIYKKKNGGNLSPIKTEKFNKIQMMEMAKTEKIVLWPW